MINNLKEILKDSPIEDIYLTGFVDVNEGEAQFYPEMRFIYFEINSKFIEFESIDQFSRMKIKVLDSIKYNFEIDEDMIKGKSSISEIILQDTMSNGNDINTLIFYNVEDKVDELICDAIEIVLNNNQTLFLDPSYYFGINIGGVDQKKVWIDNLNENTIIKPYSIKISDK